MSDNQEGTLRILIVSVCSLFGLAVLCTTYTSVQPKQLGPNYVIINGHDMRCVSMQVSDTEFAMSCDWDAIRETKQP